MVAPVRIRSGGGLFIRCLEYLFGCGGERVGEGAELLVSSSSGGLSKRSEYRAIDSLLSGPAGGVVGAAAVARSAGLQKFINLDMGGPVRMFPAIPAPLPINPVTAWEDARVANIALRIETVAAGGGSICRIENGLLQGRPGKCGGISPGLPAMGLVVPFV